MTIEQVLEMLKLHHLRVGLKGGEVQIKSNVSATIPPDVIDVLRSHKSLLADWLKKHLPQQPFKVSRDRPLPLSYNQAQLWLAEQMEQENALYNVFHAYRLQGNLEQTALVDSLTSLVSRHEVLRTVYPSGEQQVVLEPPVRLPVAFESFDVKPKEQQLKAFLIEEMETRFDLRHDWMLRAKVLSWANNSHLLLLTTHHIASDGWSMAILHRELSVLYRGFKNGDSYPLEPLPLQVADLASWQREQLNEQTIKGLLEYWTEQLKDAPPLHAIPLDFPRGPSCHAQGADIQRSLPKALSQAFDSYCSRHSATPFMGMYSVFSLLLSHWSGEQDVVIGTTIANRGLAESTGLIGYFVNSLVLRLTVPMDGTFDELLAKSRAVTLDSYEHQAMPFDRLVSALSPDRDPSYHPLFQVSINMVNTHQEPFTLEGLEVEEFSHEVTTTPFDLILHIHHEHDRYRLVWEYNSSLFHPQTIEGVHRQFEELLSNIVEHEQVSLASLRHLSRFKQPCRGHQVPLLTENYIDFWHQQVDAAPERIAYEEQEYQWTYQQIDKAADALADKMRMLGIVSQSPVGIYLPRSQEMVVSILAVFKLGAYYVPLDYQGPRERNRYIVEDAEIKNVLAYHHDSSDLCSSLIVIDPDVSAEPARATIREEQSGQDLAYVMYTSGSTGRPKGVPITQLGLVNYIQYCRHTYTNPDVSRSLFHGPLTFDATLTSLLVPIVMGHRVVAAPMHHELLFLAKALLSEGALIKVTPAHLAELTSMLKPGVVYDSPHVFVIGGENLTWETLNPWLMAFPHARFFNEYGPTEVVVGCCVYEAKASTNTRSGSVPIGQPIDNTELFVMNGDHCAAQGLKGELCIASPGVAHGYLNRPELTSKKFTSLTDGSGQATRVYRSGDVVKWQADGELVYLGREDSLIKLNGYRIELGEIERSIQRIAAVSDAVVMLQEQMLIAYLSMPNGSADDGEEQIKNTLRQQLPHYMLPHHIVMLERLPLTKNGKVDRKRLPQSMSTFLTHDVVKPRNDVEMRMLALWTDILTLDSSMSVHDNFFALGGHSMKAVQLTNRIQQSFGVAITPRDVLLHPTISSLSKCIARFEANKEWQPYTQLTTMPGLGHTFFVPGVCGQSAMFFEIAKLFRHYTNAIVLEHQGLDGQQRPFDTYHSMLESYVAVIVSLNPDQCVNLCGHSFGALIAQDLAFLLRQRGYESRIIMLDACFEDVGAAVEDLSDQSLEQLAMKLYGLTQPMQSFMIRGFKLVYKQHQRFIRDYRPLGPVKAPVLYFVAQNEPHTSQEGAAEWLNQWCPNYQLSVAQGRHDSLLHKDNIFTSMARIVSFLERNDVFDSEVDHQFKQASESNVLGELE